ncbi:xanthine dehydrogenase family protein molybdopterin-binding subunit [Sandaracinobacter neustonicus]|uniref:Xanthine dehydrogenase family protein molybdopterin-binding subunit n=1 Tax=Sandaracinobacter neustonicus TaxID=1715348 RepID=A0A501XIQ9_9SPHN|nr:molybdopterin cofactor-binding domain-containing protein [Sandaracinobacter neustonicus]TPE60157.1 xanthine dehydrogenase family protein molybdopterin-binding subunit [Sandaracinobacter neustonicus]
MLKTPPDAPPRKSRFVPSRRGFLIGAGATLGLVVGYALWPRSWPNAWEAGEGETLLGPWVKIGPDGRVTVPVPQAEMGQGVMSGFAQIVADELGANWQMMAVEPAPWHPAYANVGIAGAMTGGLPGVVRGLGKRLGEEAIRRLNLHLTGGSNSISSYHDQLRAAAAEARARLEAAAAEEWSVAASEVHSENGFIVYKANRMPFGAAAKLVDPDKEPPAPVLRAVATRPLDGKPLPRLDLPLKVDGSARFGADVRLPGMVYAAIRHGPVGGSLAAASAPKGVALVKGPNWVAATGLTTWEARRALDSVEASFSVSGRKAGSWIAEELAKAAAGDGGKEVASHGDVAAADGTVIVADYGLPYLAHVCMEPMTATARIVGGRAEVWGPIQSLTLAHWQVAEALGLEADAVVIHPTFLGGGFGRKAEPDAMVEAALIAKAVGKPVQLIWSREEDIGTDRFRPPVQAKLRGVLTADRKLIGWDSRIAVPALGNSFAQRNLPMMASDEDKPNAGDIEGLAEIPYAVEAFRAIHVPVGQPAPLGYWRSVGHSFSGFIVESFMDELAAAAGADPLAFRLAHLTDKPRHAAVLKAAADHGKWGEAAPKGFARGIALHESFGSIAAMVVTAGVVGGRVQILEVVSALDCGRAIAPDSVRQQLEGAAIMGLSAALGEEVTFAEGEAEQRNFHMYEVLKLADSPHRLATVIVPSDGPLGGVGEPGLPCAAPALANALAAATGKRVRQLPLAKAYTA